MRENNESIKGSIRKIISEGNVRDVRYMTGYTDSVPQEGEDGYGTIGFISYDESVIIEDVKISSIDGNAKGDIKLPSLESDVTIAIINEVGAYLVAYSHISIGRLIVDDEYSIKAVGVEDITTETDYDEVSETGEVGEVIVSKEFLKSTSKNDDSANETTTSPDTYSKIITKEGDVSKIEGDETGFGFSATNGTTSASMQVTPEGVTIDGGGITMGAGATEPAVLGNLLKSLLENLIDLTASISVDPNTGIMLPTTSQSILNLKTQIPSVLSAISKVK